MEKLEKNTIEEIKDNEIVELKDDDLTTISAGSGNQVLDPLKNEVGKNILIGGGRFKVHSKNEVGKNMKDHVLISHRVFEL